MDNTNDEFTYRSFKIRFYPTNKQIKKMRDQFSAQRYVSNKYIEKNNEAYKNGEKFIKPYDFITKMRKAKKENPNFEWLGKYYSRGLSQAIKDTARGYDKLFKKKGGHPHFKSAKRINKESIYSDAPQSVHFNTGRKYVIKVPFLKYIRITERDYLPTFVTKILELSSLRFIREYDKYYVSFTCKDYVSHYVKRHKYRIGIDLGIHNYATIYINDELIHPIFKPSFLNNERYKKLNKDIERLQEIISYKAEINYGKLLHEYMDKHNGKEPNETEKKIMKEDSYNSSRIRGLRKKIRSKYRKMGNIRKDLINKICYGLTARAKPKSITIEDLDVSDLLSKYNLSTNEEAHKLHRRIAESSFFTFRLKLIEDCTTYGIELRSLDQYYPSSKKCSCCGKKKKDLSLTDRIFKCDYCDNIIDRDLNAAINICNANKKHYEILVNRNITPGVTQV